MKHREAVGIVGEMKGVGRALSMFSNDFVGAFEAWHVLAPAAIRLGFIDALH